MNLDKKTLRRLVVEELNKVSEGFTTNMPEDIPTTAELMAQMKGDGGGDDVGEFKLTSHGNRDVRDQRPLDTVELVALMMADKDENSDYKLSRDRLAILSYGNLTNEELAIVNQAV